MNRQHNEDIQFVMDFSEDYLDRKTGETLAEDEKDVG